MPPSQDIGKSRINGFSSSLENFPHLDSTKASLFCCSVTLSYIYARTQFNLDFPGSKQYYLAFDLQSSLKLKIDFFSIDTIRLEIFSLAVRFFIIFGMKSGKMALLSCDNLSIFQF